MDVGLILIDTSTTLFNECIVHSPQRTVPTVG
jgi:hypothetical protein